MKNPNFFIVGAPKCGTSSLDNWLSKHPEIFMSAVKEAHHFSIDFPIVDWRERKDYDALFEDADDSHKAVGESSTWYLRSSEAVPRIEQAFPGSRYIVMLRNPVEMAPSLHWQIVFNGEEDVLSFADAWHLDGARERGEKIPACCMDPKYVQYRLTCNLGQQLAQLYETVDRDRVLTVLMDDIKTDTRKEWARILDFLGVQYWDDLEFLTENRSKHWRWPWVRDFYRFYARLRQRFNLRPLGLGVFGRLERVAVTQAQREVLSDELRKELVAIFSDDIDLLAELIGRDLSHWKTV
jgi:hypothetical protein